MLTVGCELRRAVVGIFSGCCSLVGNCCANICPLVSAAFEHGFLLQISEEAALAAALNDYLTSRSYLAGFSPSQADQKAFKLLGRPPDPQHVHTLRWYRHIAALQQDLNPESSSE